MGQRSLIFNVSVFDTYRNTHWMNELLNRCVEVMGPGGAHPYYDDLCLEYIEYGTIPERGPWRSRICPCLNHSKLEIIIDDETMATWFKLEFHGAVVENHTLVVEVKN